MLTKEECEKALIRISSNDGEKAYKAYLILEQLIEEYFELVDAMNHFSDEVMEYIEENRRLRENLDSLRDNPPLKFEELRKNMWVWDDVKKELRPNETYNNYQ